MRLDLNAKILTRDGEEAGSIKAAVIDPYTSEISDFVISTGGWLGRDVLVPRGAVESAARDGNTVRLEVTKEQLGGLPTYTMEQYVTPPASFVPPAGYNLPAQTYLWPGIVEPDEPEAVAAAAALTDDTENRVRIGKGNKVIDRDGEDVGLVEEVQFDMECGDVSSITVRLGSGFLHDLFGGGELVEIPGSQLDEFWEGSIRLTIGKAELERRAA
ncbi:MAG: PRC-barrel domain-containing protein [Chloroflexota bacterium]